MAKKPTPAKFAVNPAKIPAAPGAEPKVAPPAAAKGKSVSTPVRNTPIPKTAAVPAVPVAGPEVSYEAIAKRAFEISCGPFCGSQDDNWHRAERELKGV